MTPAAVVAAPRRWLPGARQGARQDVHAADPDKGALRECFPYRSIAGILLGACAQKEPPVQATQGVPDEVVARFVAAMDDFNPDAVRALMMPKAQIMPPNVASMSGIDNILDCYKGALADELDFGFTREAAAEAGGMGVVEGEAAAR